MCAPRDFIVASSVRRRGQIKESDKARKDELKEAEEKDERERERESSRDARNGTL